MTARQTIDPPPCRRGGGGGKWEPPSRQQPWSASKPGGGWNAAPVERANGTRLVHLIQSSETMNESSSCSLGGHFNRLARFGSRFCPRPRAKLAQSSQTVQSAKLAQTYQPHKYNQPQANARTHTRTSRLQKFTAQSSYHGESTRGLTSRRFAHRLAPSAARPS